MLLACQTDTRRQQMLDEHHAVEGEVQIPREELEQTFASIREPGYKQRDSLQSFGVTDISCPILDPKGHAMAVLTSPYIRRIDRHVGPTLDEARALLIRTAQALSVNQQAEEKEEGKA
ncbi:hypothetical protein D9M68_111270 [compost metagenome]